MIVNTEQLNKFRENVFFLNLIITASVFPFSEALVSISIGFLLIQALILQSWKHPSVNWAFSKFLLFPISIFIVYLLGSLFTSDLSFTLYELKKTVFWLVVPLAIFLSPRLGEKRSYIVLFFFIVSVTIASFIITGKLVVDTYFQLAEFRSVSIISHIRFSLQVVFSIVILAWFLINRKGKSFKINSIILVGLLIWLILFLFLLKSLLGIVAFLGVLLISFILAIKGTTNKKWKVILAFMLILTLSVPSVYVASVVKDYYNFEYIDPKTIDRFTPSGNPYQHDFNPGLRENGHLVYIYICEEELRREWNKLSDVKYDDDLNGYILGSTLIRYLASKGYRKDSVGVNKLSPDDIELILKGVTNYKFKNHTFSIYPRIYETVWELDYYRRTGDPNEKTLAQRIEFVKASFILIKENPILGIGTGNWVIKYNEAYDGMNTQLSKEKRGPSHNQYINYLVKFGIVGFSWIMFALLFPVYRLGDRNNFILILFLVIYAFANLGDANMETHMGLSLFTFFYCFLLRNSTAEMKEPLTVK